MRVTQAMLLAAGLSTRLRPLTDQLPKPLLPFWNRTILDFTLDFLKDAGVRSVAVNVHHGKEPFLKALRQTRVLPVTPFVEEPEILETGGGIKNMRSFVTEENFLVVNCDLISDIDLKAAAKFHAERKALATMVLLPRPDGEKYKTIGVDENGKIVTFPYGHVSGTPKASGVFSGIHIFHRSIFDEMPERPIFGINRDVYPPLLEKGAPVFGFVRKAGWFDLGETDLYARAQFELLKKHSDWMKESLAKFANPSKGVYIARTALVPPDVRIEGPALVSERVSVGEEARIGPNAILAPGCIIGPRCHLRNAIVFPNAGLTKRMEAEKTIFTLGGPIGFR